MKIIRGGPLEPVSYTQDSGPFNECYITFLKDSCARWFYAYIRQTNIYIRGRRMKIGYADHSGDLPDWIPSKRINGFSPRRTLKLCPEVTGEALSDWVNPDRLHEDFSQYGALEDVRQIPDNDMEFGINFLDVTKAMAAQAGMSKDKEYETVKVDFRMDPCEMDLLPGLPKAPSKISIHTLGEWRFVPKPPPPAPPASARDDSCCVIF